MILSTIGRLIIVPIALLLAALAGALTLLTLGQERITHALRDAPEDALFGMVGALFKIGVVVVSGPVVLLPILVAIVGEVARIRSMLFYVASFGLLGAALPLLGRVGVTDAGSMPIAAIFATAGFVTGFVYWLLAWGLRRRVPAA